jgi:hypothetical protein
MLQLGVVPATGESTDDGSQCLLRLRGQTSVTILLILFSPVFERIVRDSMDLSGALAASRWQSVGLQTDIQDTLHCVTANYMVYVIPVCLDCVYMMRLLYTKSIDLRYKRPRSVIDITELVLLVDYSGIRSVTFATFGRSRCISMLAKLPAGYLCLMMLLHPRSTLWLVVARAGRYALGGDLAQSLSLVRQSLVTTVNSLLQS